MEIERLKKIINKDYSEKYSLVPKSVLGNEATFYVLEGVNFNDKILENSFGLKSKFISVNEAELEELRDKFYDEISEIEDFVKSIEVKSEEDRYYFENIKSPVSKLLDKIITYSITKKASDIHFDPREKSAVIRIRMDSILSDISEIQKDLYNQVIMRIKVLSNLDIAKKSLPQDGRFTYKNEKFSTDIRVSTIPTVYGEKIVLRILDKLKVDFTFDGIGIDGSDRDKLIKLIGQPSGLILLVGPTGSGKTSTLYTILEYIKNPKLNIITVEDPVEYKVEGINQVQVNEQSGLNFETGLKAILRQDPDKVMVGEIRSLETAKVALRAAITGHLVLSTLHTRDAIGAVTRLVEMGVPIYEVNAGLIGVVSQRLVRVLCPHCKKIVHEYVDVFDREMDHAIPVGCPMCKDGYLNRTSVFEILDYDDELESMFYKGEDINKIREVAEKKGLVTLKKSLLKLVENYTTSVEEVKKNIFH